VTPIAPTEVRLYQPNILNVNNGSFQVTFTTSNNEAVPLSFFFAAFAVTSVLPGA
jgi:hypothetical protein